MGQLTDFLDGLRYKGDTGLSLRTRESSALADLSPLIAQITAGKAVDQRQYTAAAQVYLDIERQLYGSTTKYFDALSSITGLTQRAITNTGATNVSVISDATAKAAQAAADAAVASQTTFSIPEDRVAMMTADQFTGAVEAGMSGVSGQLGTGFSGLAARLDRLTSVTAASGDASSNVSFPYISALRNA